MVVDYLRSCYTTRARFFSGGSLVESSIRWYWTAPGAALLPFPTVFSSLNWLPAEDRPSSGVGEVAGASRTWNNGSIPNRPPGDHWHGDPDDFLTGSPVGPATPRTLSGIPVACIPLISGLGGVEVGGMAPFLVEIPPGNFEPCLSEPVPQVLAAVLSSGGFFEAPISIAGSPTRTEAFGVPRWSVRYDGGTHPVHGYTIGGGTITLYYGLGTWGVEVQADPPAEGQSAYTIGVNPIGGVSCGPWTGSFFLNGSVEEPFHSFGNSLTFTIP